MGDGTRSVPTTLHRHNTPLVEGTGPRGSGSTAAAGPGRALNTPRRRGGVVAVVHDHVQGERPADDTARQNSSASCDGTCRASPSARPPATPGTAGRSGPRPPSRASRPSAPSRRRSGGCRPCRPALGPAPCRSRCRRPRRCGARRRAGRPGRHRSGRTGRAGQQRQHVVEEADAGATCDLAGAVEVEGQVDLGFGGLAGDVAVRGMGVRGCVELRGTSWRWELGARPTLHDRSQLASRRRPRPVPTVIRGRRRSRGNSCSGPAPAPFNSS